MISLINENKANGINFDNKAFTLNELDLGAAEADLSTTKGMNQIGEYLNSVSIGTRDISITGYLLANSKEEMDKRKRELIKVVNPLSSFYLIKDKYSLTCRPTDTIKFAVPHYENNDKLCKFLISATAVNPCFTQIEETVVKIALWKAAFRFPLILQANKPFIMGVREPSKIANIRNTGDIETGMTVEFKAKGTVVNPYIINLNTREEIKINKTLKSGEVVLVNTNYGNKTITGIVDGNEENYFAYLDLDSVFIQLATGDNEFRWGADTNENNLEVNVIFNPQFLGV